MNSVITCDKALFLFLNNLGNETWDVFWLAVTNKFTAIPLYVVLFLLCIKKFGVKTTLIILAAVSLMIVGTDQLANAFKYGFERLRPCHDETVMHRMRLVKSYCGGKYGFFSAHAANTAAIATFFSLLFRKYFKYLPLLLIFWAVLVAYSRIYIGVHYPLDVITGIGLGIGAGRLFYIVKNKVEGLL